MDQSTWIKNFEERVKEIEIEFNAFFKNKPLCSFYFIDKSKSSLSLHFHDNNLPNEIVQALTDAFIASKPTSKIKVKT